MNMITQLFTIIRGGARQAASTMVDANALQLLDQQIHECESVIQQSKRNLTHVVAERIAVERRSKDLKIAIVEKETMARRALAEDKETLAQELAETIGDHCRQWDLDQSSLDKLQAHERDLGRMLKNAISQITDHRQEMSLLKATGYAQRAAVRLDTNNQTLVTRLEDITETTKHIRHSQQALSDQLEASGTVADAIEGDDLNRRLQAAGLARDSYSADAILERLRKPAEK